MGSTPPCRHSRESGYPVPWVPAFAGTTEWAGSTPAESAGARQIREGFAMTDHKVGADEEWLAARQALLKEEKEFTRLRDALSQRRRELPWERVDKDYRFDGARGKVTLAEMFDGRSQLIIQHFMLGPDWDEGCKSCSFWADNYNGIDIHLNHRDVPFAAVSRAPLPRIEAYRKRMGWTFPWYSSNGSDFNFDY